MNEELKVIISADINNFKKEVNKASEEIEDFEQQNEASMKAVESAIGSAKEAIKTGMAAIATATVAATTAIVGLAESTREYRINQAKLEATFKTAGASADTATEVYKDLYRVLGDDGQVTEAASHLAKLTTNQEDLSEWANICQGVYATFGDSLPIESLTEAANETAKVGAVTGALADALNWAGISEDEFNEKLEACNSEAEREQLIRKTLNGTYKKASENYEKTAKKTLAANEAQERLNRTMGKLGDKVEPLVTELKNIGASILEDLEEPLEDICDFILNDLLPAIKKAVRWVSNNKDAIIGVITGIATAYVGYKASVLAAKAAEEGITVATMARATAQKALNAVMAASPTGLAITAVTALATGVIAYAEASKEAYINASALNEEELELVENATEAAEAFDRQREAAQEAIGNEMAQSSRLEDLATELLELADASGKVTEADQVRAEYILGELNEALGTEYTMVDGIIQEYENLEQSIYDVIYAKTANALLEHKNEAYLTAIQNENEALQAVIATEKDYAAQLDITNAAEQKYADAKAALDEKVANAKTEADFRKLASEAQYVTGLEAQWNIEKEKLDKKKTAYDEAAENYGTYYNTISEYESAAMLIQEGKYNEAIELLKNKSNAYFDYADSVDEATKEVIDALFKEAVDAGIEADRIKTNFENGVAGYTEEMVKEAEKGYQDALKEWETAYQDANGVGGDLADGVKDGLMGKEGTLLSKARSIVSNIIGAMRDEADTHSPSKKTKAFAKDLGAGVEVGLNESTSNVVEAAKDMAKKTLIPMEASLQGFSIANFGGVLNSQVSSTISVGSMPKVEVNDKWVDILVKKLNDNNSKPIYLQVDGKTLAEVSVDSINQLTRQTGKLQLLI